MTPQGSGGSVSAQIVQVDLAQPLPALRVGRRCRTLAILVKLAGRPLGWIRCRARKFGEEVAPDLLGRLIASHLSRQVEQALCDRRDEAAQPPHAPAISVVICTHERPEMLERQLQALAQVRY